MASTFYDDVVSNFDLNQLGVQTNVQPLQPNYEKLRKSTYWVKRRIILSDAIIQKYQAKNEDYSDLLKAHTLSKEELKQTCINYKTTLEKCASLEHENKVSLEKQEALQNKVTNAENQCEALKSYINQLQVLVKQLETEKAALTIEKQIDNSNDKVSQLQKEKETMLKDIMSLKDVVLGKKKKGKRHMKVIKTYSKQKETSVYTSDDSESADEIDSHDKFISTKQFKKVHNIGAKDFISNLEDNFIDNASDDSNGEVSVDTGRGSSRANSVKNDLYSPEFSFDTSHKIPDKDGVKFVDIANSPITIQQSLSVATSPIMFDSPNLLFEDLHDDGGLDRSENPDYMLNDICDTTKERVFVDACTSPVPISVDALEYVDVRTSPITFKEDFKNSTNDDQTSKCMCQKLDNYNILKENIRLVDASTSPVPELSFGNNSVSIEGSDSSNNLKDNSEESNKKVQFIISEHDIEEEIHQIPKSYCDKYTCTESIEKILVDTCTSPVSTLPETYQVVDESISSVNNLDSTSETQRQFDQEQLNIECSSTDNLLVRCENDKEISKEVLNTQPATTPERICLESHNSKNLNYDHVNDSEVENILNVMKFSCNLISPIPSSPVAIQTVQDEIVSDRNECLNRSNELDQNCQDLNSNELGQKMNHMFAGLIGLKNVVNALVEKNGEDGEKQMMKQLNSFLRSTVFSEVHSTLEPRGLIGSNEVVIGKPNKKTGSIGQSSNEQCNKLKDNTMNLNLSKYSEESGNDNMLEDPLDTNEMVVNKSNDTNSKELAPDNSAPCSPIEEMTVIEKVKINKEQNNSCTDLENNIVEDENNPDNSFKENNVTNLNSPKKSVSKRKISKLEKIRNKLIPTCKIKRTSPRITKNVSKVRNIKSNENISPALKFKDAYDNAVKVMSELKSKQELGRKSTKVSSALKQATEGAEKIESPLFDCNIITTRSRTRRLSKREDDILTAVSPSKRVVNTGDINISPTGRKSRKRQADTKLDTLRPKRALRSSSENTNNEIIIPPIQIENVPNEDTKDSELNKSIGSQSESQNSNNQGDSIQSNDVLSRSVIDMNEISNNKDEVVMSSKIANIPNNQLDENNSSIEDTNNSQEQIRDDQFNECNQLQIVKEVINNNKVTKPSDSGQIITKDSRLQSTPTELNKDLTITETIEMATPLKENYISDQSKSINKHHENKEDCNLTMKNPVVHIIPLKDEIIHRFQQNVVSYSDVDIYTTDVNPENAGQTICSEESQLDKNILCAAIDKYGVCTVKYAAKKIPENITNDVCEKIEHGIVEIIASHADTQRSKMDELIDSIKVFSTKQILSGLMKYLNDSTRKCELFNKIQNGAAPAMTRSEAILLYVVEKLNVLLPSKNFLHKVYSNIEHCLFQLYNTPEFDIIESLSHFYAVLCRYFRAKSRLRCFMLDAMYCLQFKAIPLIQQCFDVCPRVLPYAHEHMAKTSLVTCLVYLLHFYKCEDRFNRAQVIRDILFKKYRYRFSEWNETIILEIFRKAIMSLRGVHNDKKMLRVALIVLCKRHGPKWCETKVINNMLLPIIRKQDVPPKIKEFCVYMLGPLLKPFPANKKAQCEITINLLLQLLKQNPSHDMKEAIYSSLICVDKHDPERVVQALLSWNPENVSKDFEDILTDYVMGKPLHIWKRLVGQTSH